ncbi:hypothetical protein GW765_02570 [Candidatus Parcubacteria bacterium]|nr:hypothetical protein [Candidatus Parcubacteria bacterium]
MKTEMKRKIRIWKPMKFSGASDAPLDISKKKPPLTALNRPDFSLGFSKKLMPITEIKIRFGLQSSHRPKMLK